MDDRKVKVFKKGDVILTEPPFVQMLNFEYRTIKCDYCYTE